MRWFISHKIIKDQDAYVVELYLDQQWSEFARDFDESDQGERRSLEQHIRDYIRQKLPGLKISTVRIMLGTMLVAAMPYANIASAADNGVYQAQAQPSMVDTVKSGDTLFKIADRYGTTVYEIKTVNGLSNDMIYVGQRLKILLKQPGYYRVSPGDTLYQIALLYDATVEQLKIVNNLTSDMLFVGQSLYIPDAETARIANELPIGVQRLGYSGEGVRDLQRALNALHYSIAEDGYYGPLTRTVVLDFQSMHPELTNDGVYGAQTRELMKRVLLTDHIQVPNPADIMALINKNHSLPPGYVPEDLTIPNVPFPFKEYDPKKQMRKEAAGALEALFYQASQEGIDLYAVSGYRSYQRQKDIFTSKVMEYGMAQASEYSAKPGESEHQSGLSMDLTSPSAGYGLSANFGNTKEGQWIVENAYRYGFIIRYPQGKEYITGYKYEPWHIRYVGRTAAEEIMQRGITLEEYLMNG